MVSDRIRVDVYESERLSLVKSIMLGRIFTSSDWELGSNDDFIEQKIHSDKVDNIYDTMIYYNHSKVIFGWATP